MNMHKLIVDPKVIRGDGVLGEGISDEGKLRYQLMYQLSHLTNERGSLAHDDKLDSLAMAVKYWVDQMALDADVQIKRRSEAELDKALKDFVNSALGRKERRKTWMGLGGRGR